MKDAVRILSRAAAKCHPLASVDPNILHAKAPRILFSGQSGFTVVPALSSGTDTSPRVCCPNWYSNLHMYRVPERPHFRR